MVIPKKDTFDIINKAYADGFCAYLEKCKLMPTTCNKNIICFRKLCNLAIELGVNKNATSMKVWKEREVNEEDKRAEIYLTEEELDVIYHYPLEGEEEKARDLFLLGYLCCQRFSDYGTLTKENFCETVSGTRIIKLRQTKTDNLVEVPITDKQVDEICNKYNYNFPKITARKINDYLLTGMKKVAESCPSLMEKYTTRLFSTANLGSHETNSACQLQAGARLRFVNVKVFIKIHSTIDSWYTTFCIGFSRTKLKQFFTELLYLYARMQSYMSLFRTIHNNTNQAHI